MGGLLVRPGEQESGRDRDRCHRGHSDARERPAAPIANSRGRSCRLGQSHELSANLGGRSGTPCGILGQQPADEAVHVRGNVRPPRSNRRRRAVQLRRYLAPQRDALSRMEHEESSWIVERDRMRLREVTDKLLRFIEYLDSIRDRTTILHDDLSTVISERIARNSNRLAALAALLLPPSVVAGLFGMNVGGIPGVNDTWAFIIIVAFVTITSIATLWVLKRINWL